MLKRIAKTAVKRNYMLVASLALVIGSTSCTMTGTTNADEASAEAGPLPELEINQAKADLGKRLFFDKRLSGDAAIACSTCHMPEHGFASPDALSEGYPGNGHFRNSIGLINVAHKSQWLHDGRLGTNLNDVTREMITEDYIMNMDMRIMQERVKQDPKYIEMFEAAGMGEPSNGKVRKLIPEYMKTLTSRGVPFDTNSMSDSAVAGQQVFNDKGCSSCHSGSMFTDEKAHNTGVPENLDIWLDPMNHQAFLAFSVFQGIENYMALKRDPGAYTQWKKADKSNMGTFQTPSLRELSQTAPYMHNGMLTHRTTRYPALATLDDVVEFYNQGGGADSHKDAAMQPLGMNDQEKSNLVAFLQALSGDPLTGPEHVWTEPYPEEYPVIEDWVNTPN